MAPTHGPVGVSAARRPAASTSHGPVGEPSVSAAMRSLGGAGGKPRRTNGLPAVASACPPAQMSVRASVSIRSNAFWMFGIELA